jgi:hypothetical protein
MPDDVLYKGEDIGKIKAASFLSSAAVLASLVLAACGSGDFGDGLGGDASDVVNPGTGINKGLVAYYRFDGNLEDSSGVGLHGSAAGTITYETGASGMCARFAGPDDFVSVPYYPALDTITKELTIAAWIKTSGTEQFDGHVVYRDSTFDPLRTDKPIYAFQMSRSVTGPESAPGFVVKREMGSTASFGGTTFPTGLWKHVAVTFDGTIVKFYVGGEEALLGGFLFAFDAIETASSDLLIGKGASGLGLHAAIDELRIYKYALSRTEIQELLK